LVKVGDGSTFPAADHLPLCLARCRADILFAMRRDGTFNAPRLSIPVT
jgi:hypothetical protein